MEIVNYIGLEKYTQRCLGQKYCDVRKVPVIHRGRGGGGGVCVGYGRNCPISKVNIIITSSN